MTANAGYHAYATGDVLTAAQVQYNLQNQTVMYFATTVARDAALTGAILVEGMVSYVPSTGVMYYNGTAWTAVTGTISPLTTKGDIFGYSTTNARVAVGTNGQFLKADSTAATGVSYAWSGLTLITSSAVSAAATVSINNCFTSTYTNYRIVFSGSNSGTKSNPAYFKLRASGTDSSASYYGYNNNYFSTSATNTTVTSNLTTGIPVGSCEDDVKFSFDVFSPQVAIQTGTAQNFVGWQSGSTRTFSGQGQGLHQVSSAYDGFTINFTSATVTGTVYVYAYSN